MQDAGSDRLTKANLLNCRNDSRYALTILKCASLLFMWMGSLSPVFSQQDTLLAKFRQPDQMARPAVWWFWGESIITKEGITRDLEALQKAGFGGAVIYEQVFNNDPHALKSLSPQWLNMIRFAASECARLKLRLEVNCSDGYVAGGPWITPDLAMQRLVSSDTTLEGSRTLSVNLPPPPVKLGYYKDIAVLAFPAPGSQADALPQPALTSSPRLPGLEHLIQKNGNEKITIPASTGPALIRFDYGKEVTLRSLTYAVSAATKALVIATQMPGNWSDGFYGENMVPVLPIGELQSSNDNKHWHKVCQLPGRGRQFETWDKRTLAFPPARARYFRIRLFASGKPLKLGGLQLSGDARIDNWEIKTGNTVDFASQDQTPAYPSSLIIDTSSLIDLTDAVTPEGKLHWKIPPGRWTVLRLGHTPTGAKTKHGRPENMGLECDKLSEKAARVQFNHYVGVILKEINKVPGAKLSGVNMDSGEFGSQNWTETLPATFGAMNGYAIKKYLPALAGYIVCSKEVSDRFLYDFRRTIADMMTQNYYGTFQTLCHGAGMQFMAQAPGIATCMPSDNIAAKGRTDIPMAEFWMTQKNGTIDCKEAASAGHLYGKNIIAAESFTGSMADATPAAMKPLADAALAQGINRFIVLAYMHQPWDDRKPGVTENRFYLPYQRHNTWWPYSRNFWMTLARSAQMMQTGKPVIDLLYYLGNNTPLKIATWRMRPVPPGGYDYDVCSEEALLKTQVKDGRILLPDGMSYRLLILADAVQLSPAAAGHIQQLIDQGAVVLSRNNHFRPPTLRAGLAHPYTPPPAEIRLHVYNARGTLILGKSLTAALTSLRLPKDFEVPAGPDTTVLYAHRSADSTDIYFVANHSSNPLRFTAAFRVASGIPELWDPVTGTVSAPDHFEKLPDHRISLSLSMEPQGAVFVVFRHPSGGYAPETAGLPKAPSRPVEELPVFKKLNASWRIRFAPGGGVPDKDFFWDTLRSWTASKEKAIQYYSGTATYSQDFSLREIPAGRLLLDLGKVAVVARVRINGKDCGTVWQAPYATDITGKLNKGTNHIDIQVANLWTNRLIGDAGLPAPARISWETFNPYRPEDELLPSGLLGPVTIKCRSDR